MPSIKTNYKSTTSAVTSANNIINPKINLQIYLNNVVYETSKYDNTKINNKLDGPINENIP